MISVEAASEYFAGHLGLSPATLECPIVADRDYPPFDRVMMDGIAVSYEQFSLGVRSFKIQAIQAAGQSAWVLNDRDHCFEVMTGAPLPVGTNLVIPYEHLRISDSFAHVVHDQPRIKLENIHLKGSDCKKGEVLLPPQSQLNGPHEGIAASVGKAFYLSKPARILIISTGDELVEVDQIPLDHQIRRSNAHALRRSLLINGYSDVSLDHLVDDAEMVASHYRMNAPHFDLMIYSGGVSKGKFDYLPSVWASLGVKKYFHEVSQRPGKPLWFGSDETHQTKVIGLPGNPVSSLVCLHRYVIKTKKMYACLSEEVIFKKNLTYFLPVKTHFELDGTLWATPLKIKNSGEFSALALSDGFIELPANQDVFEKSKAFSFWPWRAW